MNLTPTPEQLAIASSAAELLTDLDAVDLARRTALDPAAGSEGWATAAAQGWFGLAVAESDGGIGYGMAEAAMLAREVGRHLLPGPFLGTMLAGLMPSPLREAVVAGSERVGLLIGQQDTHLVADGADASLLLQVDGHSARLYDADAMADAVVVMSIDPGTTMVAGHLTGTPVFTHDGPELLDAGRVLIAGMASGIAEATRDMSVSYAKEREQFGRPIGVNQAIKHRCADMAVRAEAAWSQTCMAAVTVDEHRHDASFQAASAATIAVDAARANADRNVQVHGGIGFTWEADPHLFLTRARLLELCLEDPRQRLASVLAMTADSA